MIRRKDRKEGLVPRDRWEPAWVSPATMLNDMDRLFDDFRSEWANTFMVPRDWPTNMIRSPLIDLADKGKEYLVRAELPGIKKEDLNIELTENSVVISGEMKAEENDDDKDKGYIRRERRYASFYRSLPLPENIVTEKADAELKNGVLTVTLPKAASPSRKSKKVRVK